MSGKKKRGRSRTTAAGRKRREAATAAPPAAIDNEAVGRIVRKLGNTRGKMNKIYSRLSQLTEDARRGRPPDEGGIEAVLQELIPLLAGDHLSKIRIECLQALLGEVPAQEPFEGPPK